MGLATTLDPARDLQRLNSLIVKNLDELKLFTEPNSVYCKEINSSEDKIMLQKNVRAMIDTAVKLQQVHITYRTLVDREMKYGSRLAPIGDDNYLHFLRGGLSSNSTLPILKHHNLGLDKSFIQNEPFSHY